MLIIIMEFFTHEKKFETNLRCDSYATTLITKKLLNCTSTHLPICIWVSESYVV